MSRRTIERPKTSSSKVDMGTDLKNTSVPRERLRETNTTQVSLGEDVRALL